MKTQEKYKNDLVYRQLVDKFHSLLIEAKYTPSELKEASILASSHYEIYSIKKIHFMPDQLDMALKIAALFNKSE